MYDLKEGIVVFLVCDPGAVELVGERHAVTTSVVYGNTGGSTSPSS